MMAHATSTYSTTRPGALTGVLATALACALAASCQGGAGAAATVTLTADRAVDVQADGLTPVTLTALVTPPDAVDALSFGIVAGFGDLSASRVPVVNGTVTVSLFPPRETELQSGAALTTVKAFIPLAPAGQEEIAATTDIAFVLPTTGAPVLLVTADPPFVTIGSGETMKLKIEGRRLTSPTVSITTSSGAIVLPAEVTLTVDGASFTAEIDIPMPTEPTEVDITVSGGGAEAQTVTAHFTAEGAPSFDVDGTFAQVSFGRKRISNYDLLKNDPDCVAADAISLVTIQHVGDQVTIHSESCDIKMPTLEISVLGFDGSITPEATPGFIRATNLRTNDISFALAGATFDVPTDQLLPVVVGAELANAATDDLPTDPNIGMLADDDDDGAPGVTIPGPFFPVPDTHLCSRTFTDAMVGEVVDSNQISGLLTTRSESNTYGGSSGSPTIEDVPSPFHLLRVDGEYGAINISGLSGNPDEITCDDVIRFTDQLLASFERPELVCD